jgi:chromosome segregation ATPase
VSRAVRVCEQVLLGTCDPFFWWTDNKNSSLYRPPSLTDDARIRFYYLPMKQQQLWYFQCKLLRAIGKLIVDQFKMWWIEMRADVQFWTLIYSEQQSRYWKVITGIAQAWIEYANHLVMKWNLSYKQETHNRSFGMHLKAIRLWDGDQAVHKRNENLQRRVELHEFELQQVQEELRTAEDKLQKGCDSQEKLWKLKEELHTLRADRDYLHRVHADEVKELNRQMEHLKQEYKQDRQTWKQASDETVQDVLAAASASAEQAQSRLKELQESAIAAKDAEVKKAKAVQEDAVKKAKAELTHAQTALAAVHASAQQDRTRLQSAVNAKEEELKKAKAELEAAQTKHVHDYEQLLRSSEERMSFDRQQAQHAIDGLRGERCENITLLKSRNALQAQVQAHSTKIDKLEAELSDLRSDLIKSQQQRQKLTDHISSIRSIRPATAHTKRGASVRTATELKSAEDKLKTANETIQTLQGRVTSLEQQIAEKRANGAVSVHKTRVRWMLASRVTD